MVLKKIDYKNKSIIHFAKCNQMVNDISTMIMNDEPAKEKFWNNSACDLLYGLIFFIFERIYRWKNGAKENYPNINQKIPKQLQIMEENTENKKELEQ